jgi:hypothetical protein
MKLTKKLTLSCLRFVGADCRGAHERRYQAIERKRAKM